MIDRTAPTRSTESIRAVARGLGLGAGDLVHEGGGSAAVRLDVIRREPIRPHAGCVLVASSKPGRGSEAALAVAVTAALIRVGERAVAVVRSSADPELLGPGAAAALDRERHVVGAAERLLSGFAEDARGTAAAGRPSAPMDATEVMEVLALARDRDDLRARLGRIVLGRRAGGGSWSAGESGVVEPTAAILQPALEPVLAAGAGGAPMLVHTAPRSSGCASVVADLIALRCADWVLTEAAGGADLGVTRFCDVKCRASGLRPVGVLLGHAGRDARSLVRGVEAARLHGLPVVVVLDRHLPSGRMDRLRRIARRAGADRVVDAPCEVGAEAAAADAIARALPEVFAGSSSFRFLSPRRASLAAKVDAIAVRVAGTRGARFVAEARADLDAAERDGLGELSVCPVWDGPAADRGVRGPELVVARVEPLSGAGFVRLTVRVSSRIGT